MVTKIDTLSFRITQDAAIAPQSTTAKAQETSIMANLKSGTSEVGAADALKILTFQQPTAQIAPASAVEAAAIGTVFGAVKAAVTAPTATTEGVQVSFDAPTTAALILAMPTVTAFLATIGVAL